MPDLATLTDNQRSALKEFAGALDLYRMAVETTVEARRSEVAKRILLDKLIYDIAGCPR